MMSESEFGKMARGNSATSSTSSMSSSGSGSTAGLVRALPATPATVTAMNLESDYADPTSPTSSSGNSHNGNGSNANPPALTPNPRLTGSSRSRSSPYIPSPLNPSSLLPLSSSPPQGSTPPVAWRTSFSASPLTAPSSSTPIVAPVPKGPPPPPPGAALPRVSSGSVAGPNSRPGSVTLQRFASEEEDLLNSGAQVTLRPRSRPPSTGPNGARPGSMVLYRLANDDDRNDPFTRPGSTMSLNPPNFRPGSISRFSTASQSPSVFSLSSDSKYPVFGSANPFEPPSAPFHQGGYDSSRSSSPGPSLHGLDRSSFYPGGAGTPPSPTSAATQQGAFLPYDYDPAMDQDIVDDDDALHEPDPKGYKEGMGGASIRGVANIFCLVILALGLLSLFVVGPVIDAVQKEAFARTANQPQIIAGPVGPASPSDMLSDSSSSSVTDPFNLGSLTPTTSTSRTTSRARTTSTTLFDENGDPIDPATATDTALSTSTTRRVTATTATDDTLGRRRVERDVRGRGGWAGLKLPRETGAPLRRDGLERRR